MTSASQTNVFGAAAHTHPVLNQQTLRPDSMFGVFPDSGTSQIFQGYKNTESLIPVVTKQQAVNGKVVRSD